MTNRTRVLPTEPCRGSVQPGWQDACPVPSAERVGARSILRGCLWRQRKERLSGPAPGSLKVVGSGPSLAASAGIPRWFWNRNHPFWGFHQENRICNLSHLSATF